ncbi:glycoside hydrolase family 13 protein [Pholiota molesta]|nr:glycoside hydrolase family 13 protein [Pholiota molesta]
MVVLASPFRTSAFHRRISPIYYASPFKRGHLRTKRRVQDQLPLDGERLRATSFASENCLNNSRSLFKLICLSHTLERLLLDRIHWNQWGRIKGREGYFNIDPILKIKARSPILDKDLSVLPPKEGAILKDELVNLPLDGLSILTVVSKWMGPVDEWRQHFNEAKERGYTMLHYTPLQERGESDSPYSIRSQLAYDSSLFGANLKEEEGRKKVVEILKVAREEYGLLSLTDVVLNHTANDTPWLNEHPEAGFSPANTPHLTPAFELDSAIIDFSSSLASRGLPTVVASENDVNVLIAAFDKVVRGLNLWQYYVLDPKREKDSIRSALTSGNVEAWTEKKITGLGRLASRFGVHVESAVAAGFVQAAFTEIKDVEALANAWVNIIEVLNVPLYKEWESDIEAAIGNVRNRLKYARLDPNGPRMGEITKKNPLMEIYFTRLAPTLTQTHSFIRISATRSHVWGDCVKLRYGDSQPGRVFDGFRIDNCHSTPLAVGTRMLDAARVVCPDLYVCAELFTGSEDMDLMFVRELGVNSLIRESGNGWDPKELSRLLYRHGVGKPVGSMDAACMLSKEDIPSPTGKGPIRKAIIHPLNGDMPHALLYDQTHDNEPPLHKRSAEDALSTAALVAFSYSAIGSVKGFDDLYPKLLNLVQEKRRYEVTNTGEGSGIAKVKRVVNELHLEMVLNGYEEGHVHQENDYIVLHRVQPVTQRGYLLVAHTAFHKGSKARGHIEPFKLRRTRARFVLGASIDVTSYDIPEDEKLLRGLPSKLQEMPPVVVPQGLDHEGPYAEVVVPEYFPPGSIMIFETQLQAHDADLDTFCASGAQEAFADLDLVDLNVILHRADVEERDATAGKFGAYEVPGLGKMVYCGLEGWMHPLRHVMRYNDLGHPLCGHLREGSWALDYVHERLSYQVDVFPKLAKPAQWFKERFDRVKKTVPNYMRPKYFGIVVSEAYKAARRAVVEQCSDFVASGHAFTHDLALTAVQMYGQVKSASLDPGKSTPSLAAGLPHFTTNWARCWGRDVFISLSGLFLTTGNFEAAKAHILAFASTLKHGLIPNLLDSVRSPRYNSRDSPWWMLQNIQDYARSAPEGIAILAEPVKRRFPLDDTWVPWDDPRAYAHTSSLAEIIQEIYTPRRRIHFREYNAGPNLDMQMKDAGFNIDIEMGESVKAGTKGVPGTPRDGAPIEITGLLKSTLRWLAELSSRGKFPFKGVQVKPEETCHVSGMVGFDPEIVREMLLCAFGSTVRQRVPYQSSLVNRRGIYKDVYGSGPSHEWADYQFRCNFPIAMTVAPELFDERHALGALQLADQVLRAPLGMKLWIPMISNIARIMTTRMTRMTFGCERLNYHNGPEWGWPLGYFLERICISTQGLERERMTATRHYTIHQILVIPRKHVATDPWKGLPELTNANGMYCRDSCNTQAWSSSTLLDFLAEVAEV